MYHNWSLKQPSIDAKPKSDWESAFDKLEEISFKIANDVPLSGEEWKFLEKN